MGKQKLLDRLLSPEDQERVLSQIRQIEKNSSGEVRVHLTDQPVKDVYQEARKTFSALGMTATRQRNGVLIFLSIASRRFAIIGDEGIDRVTASDYWDKLRDSMAEQFQAGHFADGLLELLTRVEEVLILNFPYQEGDVNELPDEISYNVGIPNPLPWLIAGGILLSPLFNLFTALALRRSGLESLLHRNKFAALINLAAWVTGVLCYLAWYLFYRSWS